MTKKLESKIKQNKEADDSSDADDTTENQAEYRNFREELKMELSSAKREYEKRLANKLT